MALFTTGSILINTSTNKLYGVLVTVLPNNKLIVFRLDKDTHPIFSKFEIHQNIAKVGNINEYQYSTIKTALLKHYRTYNLTLTEKQLLQPLMNFAFPLGIPEYHPEVELPERDIQLMDLNSKLTTGCRIQIHTPIKSSYNHLNDKTVSILDKTPQGLWIYIPSNEQDITKLNNSLSFLFYKNPDIPTFSGISRIIPINDESLSKDIQEVFNKLKEEDSLTTTMEFNGEKVRVTPKNMKIIFPDVYSGMTYNIHNDSFVADSDIITPALSQKLGTSLLMSGGGDLGLIDNDNEPIYYSKSNTDDVKDDIKDDLLLVGGNKIQEVELSVLDADEIENSKYLDSSSKIHNTGGYNIDDVYIDNSIDNNLNEDTLDEDLTNLLEDSIDLKILKELPHRLKDDTTDDKETVSGRSSVLDYDEENIVEIINEDDLDNIEVVEKIKVVEVDETQKIYPESVQRGDLRSYKLEQIPPLLRTDDIQRHIIKQINIISLLKNSITDKENNIIFPAQDYKPLLSKYLKGDFTNKFLIPLVINKKKIYTDVEKQDEYDTDTHTIIDNYYGNIANIIYMQDKKNISINNDAYINNIITELNPTIVNEEDNIGLLFRLGSEFQDTDYNKLFQDTLTIKYCDKNMKCQSYSLNTMNFDYQVNLGPMGRFIQDNEEMTKIGDENDDIEENVTNDLLYNTSQYKIYYQGDLIRIIGYLRPPLDYFNNNLCSGNDQEQDQIILANLYDKEKANGNVITVNLEDINSEIIDEENEQFDITIHPEKFVLFILPNNIVWNNLEQELIKIIPNIDDIIKLYLKPEKNTIDYIYNTLEKFEYDTNTLSQYTYDKIIENNQELRDIYIKLNDELVEKFKMYLKSVESNKKVVSDDKKFRYIPDTILEDISKFYFETYENQGSTVDTDDMRLKWFMMSFDNGRYFFKTLFINYLKSYEEKYKLENLETELALLKDKHLVFLNNQTVTNNITNTSSNLTTINSTVDCQSKTTEPNVIKYPNLERLEQDNGKVAVDSEGNVIMTGDYALVDVDGGKQLYKRDIVGNVDMWIKEDLTVLYKLVHDKKNKCVANPEMKLEDANKCIFNLDNLKCEINDVFDITKEKLEIEKNINDLQKQIDYIKHIPVLLATTNREIIEYRTVLLNKLNSMKLYWKFKEEEEEKLAEYIKKTITRNKPCIHYDITDYLFRIGNSSNDRYEFARSVFRNFLNIDSQFDHDYTTFDSQTNDNNFTYCNICNQQLLCNHIKFAVSYIENDQPIDYDKMISIYTKEINGGYYCKACEEFIANTDVLDLDDFAKGEDGFRMKTRELAENIPLIEKQKQYVDNLIKNAIESNPEDDSNNMQQKISIFRLLKRMCGLEVLSILDEVEMINFLKSFSFTKKNDILQLLIIKYGTANVAMLRKQMEQLYLIYLCCDIAARLLIILQTTKQPYEIHNKECNGNIIGYPLINDINESNGTNFMICLLNQMAILPDYNALNNMKSSMFLDRVKKQVEDDNFVKTRINNALNNISNEIDHMYEFQQYKTNYWKSFLPRLNHIQLNWSPEKILTDNNINQLNHKNWSKMVEVGNENCIYIALNIINNINQIIEKSDKIFGNVKGNVTSCCADAHNANDKFKYIKYFINQNSDIIKQMKQLKESNDLVTKLYDINRISVPNILYDPLYKPSQTVFKFNLDATSDEIRDIYLKFIETGINKGKLHIFDKYGRCILSNENKNYIKQKTYSQQDYKRIEDSITSTNQINLKNYITKDIKPTTLEIQTITNIHKNIPKLDTMNFINDYLKTIIDAFPIIFNTTSTSSTTSYDDILVNKKNIGGNKDRFNIHHHLSKLNAQIEIEINHLVQKITTTDKLIKKYSDIISNLGYYRKLYEEFKNDSGVDDNKSDNFRYNKKENSIQLYLKYLNDVINQIKNQKLLNPLNKEHIRPQFRDFLQYGENVGLFKMLDKSTREIYDFARLFKSKIKFKILFPEMVSSILHYILVISLANLFDVMDNTKLGKQKTDIIDFKFKQQQNDVDPALADFAQDMEMDINMHGDDAILDEDTQELDLIESFEFKNNTNLKTVGDFIITYLDRINDTQNTYDELTNEYVRIIITQDNQKKIENTLRTFEWLHMENNEEMYQMAMMKMRLDKVNYANIYQYIKQEKGDNFLDEEFNGDDNIEKEVDNKKSTIDEEDDIPKIVTIEDIEDGGMDYDYLAVDED